MKTQKANLPRRSALRPGKQHAPRNRAATGAVPDGGDIEAPPRVRVSEKDGKFSIGSAHPDARIGYLQLKKALGSTDGFFCESILQQLVNITWTDGRPDEHSINFMLAVIKGIKPNDQIEAMLAVQMAAVHMASMKFARQIIGGVDTLPQQDSAERTFNKLMRTFPAQIEALRRYRTGGEQKVTVQHVSVSDGGQAIVGNVTQAPRETAPDKVPAWPPAITDAKTVPLDMINESKEATPVPARHKKNK